MLINVSIIAVTHIRTRNKMKIVKEPPVWDRGEKGIKPPKLFPAAWKTIIIIMLPPVFLYIQVYTNEVPIIWVKKPSKGISDWGVLEIQNKGRCHMPQTNPRIRLE